MLTPTQYRANASAFDALALTSDSPDQIREFQRLAHNFFVLANNQQWMAENQQNTVIHTPELQQEGA
jgi:hypothetical protein